MVYLNKYSKRIVPGYIHPMEDELFSSWLCRFADNILITTINLVNIYSIGYNRFWIKDVDIEPIAEIKSFIIQNTPIDLNCFNELFLNEYDGRYFLNNRQTGISRHFLSLGANQ
jgi:hypothetical protein